MTAVNYSGARSLSAGDTLHFNVRFVEGLQSAAEVDLSAVRILANQGLFILIRPVDRP